MNGRAGCNGTVCQYLYISLIYFNQFNLILFSQANAAAGGIIDDENSQAEGSNVEGAVGYSRNDVHLTQNANNNNATQQQQQNHPHYENIYESLEQYNNNAAVAAAAAAAIGGAGVNAVAPAEELPQPQGDANIAPPNMNNLNNANNSNNQPRLVPNISYRNDLYDRTNTTSPAYDVPRAVRSGLGFRRNFHIDLQGGNCMIRI